MRGSRNSDNVKRRGWNERRMSNADDGGIRKFCVDRVTAEIIIGVIMRMAVREISGSTAGIDFRGMIEDLTIKDTNLEMRVKMTILVERTAEIEVRVRILVEGALEALVVSRVGRFRIPMYSRGGFHKWIKTILDFDRKSLAIPDSQIDTVVKTIEEGNVEIDLSKTGSEEKRNRS
ncbi:uncharacterized protein TNCV_698331 [Trichonephila clavipes]|nr:uncharacterized protein TNCV_698331 [Trichonephila clavipes]